VFLERLRRRGWEVTGVDTSPAAAAAADRAFGIAVHVGELADVALPGGSYDLVRLNHVIEHLRDPAATMRVIARLLAPGGLLYVGTPNVESLAFRWNGRRWPGIEVPRHLWLFSPATLTRAIEQAGLVVRSLETTTMPTLRWALARRAAGRRERIVREALVWAGSGTARFAAPLVGDNVSCWAERPR
jgi:2-polyprenyl-3-methyl-5-hydroxy-6-metoxy-1,4-benzoquinol methylase